MFNEGVKLFNDNHFKEALANFEVVLKQNPRSIYARVYAGKCKAAIKQGVGPDKNTLKKQLESIKIPQMAFTDAPIGDVLDYLSQRATELSDRKVALNFIYKGTPEQRSNTLVTLSVRNVPMTEAIRYVGQLTQTVMKYEEHAVIADPNGTATVQTAPALVDPSEEKDKGTIFGEKPKKGPFDN